MSPAGFAADIAGHRRYLMRVALGRMRDAHRAEDAVQETLLAALRAAESFDGRSRLRTWLTGILLHKICDHFRASAREEDFMAIDDDIHGGIEDEVFDANGGWRCAPAAWGDPERVLGGKQSWAAFVAAIEALPPRQARAFVLRELEGMATDEICAALGVTADNLWVLLFRARLGLRSALASAGVGVA